MIDFLLVTALGKEFRPLRDVFKAKRLRKEPQDSRQYYEATLETKNGLLYSIRLVCAGGKGPAYATAALAAAIPKWKPRHVIMTGIAATIPGESRHIGDILVADTIVDLSEWKVLPSEDEVRVAIHDCDFELVRSVEDFLPWHIKTHIGVIVAQTHLVKSAPFRKQLVGLAKKVTGRKDDVIGIEMEGGGLGIGVKTQPRDLRPGFIMLKGGVDFANYHKNDAAQKQAAHDAAQFVWDFLIYGPIGKTLEDQQVTTDIEDAIKDYVCLLDLVVELAFAARPAALTFMESRRLIDLAWRKYPTLRDGLPQLSAALDPVLVQRIESFVLGPLARYLEAANYALPTAKEDSAERWSRDYSYFKDAYQIARKSWETLRPDLLKSAMIGPALSQLYQSSAQWTLLGFGSKDAFDEYVSPTTKTMFASPSPLEIKLLERLLDGPVDDATLQQEGVPLAVWVELGNRLLRDRWATSDGSRLSLTKVGQELLKAALDKWKREFA